MSSFKTIINFALFSLCSFYSTAQITRKGMKPVETGPGIHQRKADFSIDQFRGKWQEELRSDYHDNDVSFTDTALLNFTDSDKVETRTTESMSMTMNGVAEIDDDNHLAAAADIYTIKSLAKNVLVLDDNNGFIHRFKKVDHFTYEEFKPAPVAKEEHNTPVKVTLSSILRKWTVYKRIAKPGAINDNMSLIKYLNLLQKTNDSTATGDITFYQGQSSQQLPCTVSLINGSDIKIVAGKNTWNFSIFQADSKDFIFGNEGLLYFSKAE